MPWAALAAVILLGGCAVVALPDRGPEAWAEAPRWPPPPATPRLVWVGELRDTADVVVRRGWLDVAAELLVGRDEPLTLVRPLGIAATERYLAIADPGLRAVLQLDLKNGKVRVLDSVAGLPLAAPVAVAASADGRWCLTDSGRPLVACWRPGEAPQPLPGAEALLRPTGIAFDASGRIFVTDTLSHRVFVFAPDGGVVDRIGGRGDAPGSFNYPLHLAVEPEGVIVVADTLNARVQRIRVEDGEVLATFGGRGDVAGRFIHPKGVARDSAGHLYVTDGATGSLQVFDGQGRLLLALGGDGSLPGRFSLPAGVAVDAQDRVFVADSLNGRIQILRYVSEATP